MKWILLRLRPAWESSTVRRVCAESLVCAAILAVAKWVRETRSGVVAGVGGDWPNGAAREVARINSLLEGSWLLASGRWLKSTAVTAWADGVLGRLSGRLLEADLPTRVEWCGIVLITAVATHALALQVSGVEIGVIGWSVRAGAVVVALVMLFRPRDFAAAWTARSDKR